MILYTALGVLVLVVITWILWSPGRYRYPPGPKGLPFIGVAWQIHPKSMHEKFMEWTEKFGEVFLVKIYGTNYIVLNSFDTIYDAMFKRSDVFAGRIWTFRINEFFKSIQDVVFSPMSKKWQKLKSVMTQTLKMYENNLDHLESISLKLIEEKLDELYEIAKTGEAVDIKPILNTAVVGIMSSILYGRKLSKSSVADLLRMSEEGMRALGHSVAGMALDTFPWMRFFPLRKEYKILCDTSDDVFNTIQKEVAISRDSYIPGNPRCFTEGLFEYQRKQSSVSDNLKLTDLDCLILNYDLLVPGTITSLHTLSAAFAILVNHPRIQNKMAEEIKSVIGERRPRIADRASMHYCEAVASEVLRYHTLNPTGVLRATMEDVNILNYHIPKGTAVIFNMWKINHDPELWGDPWQFRPERFLDDEGKPLPKDHLNQRMFPFGGGRRICPGEVIARNRIFLIVISFLQNYEFLPESEERRPLHDPRTYDGQFTLWPKRYNVLIKPRL